MSIQQGQAASRMEAPGWLAAQVSSIEENEALDRPLDSMYQATSGLAVGRTGEVLRGEWLGHALHPLLTDIPLGCWMSAGMLDLVGGKKSRPAAQKLVAMGLMWTPVTVASGLADWSGVSDRKAQRVGFVHAVGNAAVAGMYFMSWRARRKGHHVRGKVLGLLGGTLALGTGYLGGHMSFAQGVGQGARGLRSEGTSTSQTAGDELVDLRGASQRLGVPEEQVEAMVGEGLLTPVDDTGRRFHVSELEAVRTLGG